MNDNFISGTDIFKKASEAANEASKQKNGLAKQYQEAMEMIGKLEDARIKNEETNRHNKVYEDITDRHNRELEAHNAITERIAQQNADSSTLNARAYADSIRNTIEKISAGERKEQQAASNMASGKLAHKEAQQLLNTAKNYEETESNINDLIKAGRKVLKQGVVGRAASYANATEASNDFRTKMIAITENIMKTTKLPRVKQAVQKLIEMLDITNVEYATGNADQYEKRIREALKIIKAESQLDETRTLITQNNDVFNLSDKLIESYFGDREYFNTLGKADREAISDAMQNTKSGQTIQKSYFDTLEAKKKNEDAKAKEQRLEEVNKGLDSLFTPTNGVYNQQGNSNIIKATHNPSDTSSVGFDKDGDANLLPIHSKEDIDGINEQEARLILEKLKGKVPNASLENVIEVMIARKHKKEDEKKDKEIEWISNTLGISPEEAAIILNNGLHKELLQEAKMTFTQGNDPLKLAANMMMGRTGDVARSLAGDSLERAYQKRYGDRQGIEFTRGALNEIKRLGKNVWNNTAGNLSSDLSVENNNDYKSKLENSYDWGKTVGNILPSLGVGVATGGFGFGATIGAEALYGALTANEGEMAENAASGAAGGAVGFGAGKLLGHGISKIAKMFSNKGNDAIGKQIAEIASKLPDAGDENLFINQIRNSADFKKLSVPEQMAITERLSEKLADKNVVQDLNKLIAEGEGQVQKIGDNIAKQFKRTDVPTEKGTLLMQDGSDVKVPIRPYNPNNTNAENGTSALLKQYSTESDIISKAYNTFFDKYGNLPTISFDKLVQNSSLGGNEIAALVKATRNLPNNAKLFGEEPLGDILKTLTTNNKPLTLKQINELKKGAYKLSKIDSDVSNASFAIFAEDVEKYLKTPSVVPTPVFNTLDKINKEFEKRIIPFREDDLIGSLTKDPEYLITAFAKYGDTQAQRKIFSELPSQDKFSLVAAMLNPKGKLSDMNDITTLVKNFNQTGDAKQNMIKDAMPHVYENFKLANAAQRQIDDLINTKENVKNAILSAEEKVNLDTLLNLFGYGSHLAKKAIGMVTRKKPLSLMNRDRAMRVFYDDLYKETKINKVQFEELRQAIQNNPDALKRISSVLVMNAFQDNNDNSVKSDKVEQENVAELKNVKATDEQSI